MRKFVVATAVGSNRRESINRQRALALMRVGADEAFEFGLVQIDDLPMHNRNPEPSRPAPVLRFADEVAEADAVMFVTPKHIRSIAAVLKNAIDWGSKPLERNAWKDKCRFPPRLDPGFPLRTDPR